MGRFRDLMEKVGIVRSVENTYTYTRDQDGVDEVFQIRNQREDREVCSIHFWDEPDTNNAAGALAQAKELVADLNKGRITEELAVKLFPGPVLSDIDPFTLGKPDTDFRKLLGFVQYVDAVDRLRTSFDAAQDLISGWAIQGVQETMLHGDRKGVPFSEMSREQKIALLTSSVDWPRYTQLGMDEKTPLTIIFNALDGKPPEKWLEQTPSEAKSRQAEMKWFSAQFDAAAERTRNAQETFDQRVARMAGAVRPREEPEMDLDR